MKDYLTALLAKEISHEKCYRADFLSKEDRLETLKLVSKRMISPIVIQELKALNAGVSVEMDRNLETLNKAGSVAVVTGQQIGFLGGPLLTLYKALSAVKLAKELQQESAVEVVPVFWMQSEDHDFLEISKAKFFAQNESVIELSLEPELPGVGDSVGKIVLSQSAAKKIAEFLEGLGFAADLSSEVKRAYSAGATLSQAFLRLMQTFTKQYGLLYFDPLSPKVKELHKDLIASSFLRAASIESSLGAQIAEIKRLGLTVQVPLKEKSPLWFVSQGGVRERLVEASNGELQGKSFSLSKEQIMELLSKSPQVFTSSALIRPIFQDSIFPTAAYVGGNAELNYWAEIKPLHQYFGLTQPLVVPRAKLVVIEQRYQHLLQKLGVKWEAVLQNVQEFVKARFKESSFDSEKLFGAAKAKLSEAVGPLNQVFSEIDLNLLKLLKQSEDSWLGSLERLKGRYERSLTEREEASARQFSRVRSIVLPNEVEQERELSWLYFALKYGQKFIQAVYDAIEPLQGYIMKPVELGEGDDKL